MVVVGLILSVLGLSFVLVARKEQDSRLSMFGATLAAMGIAVILVALVRLLQG